MSLFRCPHTHKVVTSKGEVIYKECGKCRYCRMKRSAILSAGLTHASKLYKHVIFFTLTYNNDNLPLAHDYFGDMADPYGTFYLDANRFIGDSTVPTRESETPFIKLDYTSVSSGIDEVPPIPVNYEGNAFGVLCKRDIQLFQKRLRRFKVMIRIRTTSSLSLLRSRLGLESSSP